MNSSTWLRPMAMLCGFALSTACASTHSRVTALDASYPVSLSPSVRGPEGAIVNGEDLQKVGAFEHAHTSNHMLLGWVSLDEDYIDLSAEIDKQVEAQGGQAIVNLRVEDTNNTWGMWAAFPFMGLLPVYNDVKVSGDIVRLLVAEVVK
jgi:hypothetical protein